MPTFLLNWRVWAGIILLIFLSFVEYKVYSFGEQHIQIQWDKAKETQLLAQAKENEKNKEITDKLKQQVQEAKDNAKKREKTLQKSVDVAVASSNSLRNQLTSIRRSLPSLTEQAVRKYADTASTILGDCQSKYQELAARADGLSSDLQTLIEAWPQPKENHE